jgi:hypothetical protein
MLNSYHLSVDPTREVLFKLIRSDIEGSRGESTIQLEGLGITSQLKELCSLEGKLKNPNETSSYSLKIGLNSYKLKYGKNLIGRYEDNDIIIESKAISRRHCCIVVHSDNRMELFDTASKNGTKVNGKKVQKCQLNPGDEITLGSFHNFILSA